MIVFFDIDGTLISGDERYCIPASTVDAIRAARRRGHLMYINTGRAFVDVEEEIRQIGFDGYACSCGAYIRCGEEILQNRILAQEDCRKVASLIHDCDMTPVYERWDTFFVDQRVRLVEQFLPVMKAYEQRGKCFWRDIDEPDFSFHNLVAWYDGKSDIARFRQGVEPWFDCIDRGAGFVELAAKGVSKASAIEKICRYHGISEKDAIAIGDSMNDAPMLRAVKNSVAMGDSSAGVKEMASFVTTGLYEDGIAYALAHYGLI